MNAAYTLLVLLIALLLAVGVVNVTTPWRALCILASLALVVWLIARKDSERKGPR